MMKQTTINMHEPPIHVAHTKLRPWSASSRLTRCCVKCEDGILATRRDGNDKIVTEDRCLGCGQAYVYTDIEQLRVDNPRTILS